MFGDSGLGRVVVVLGIIRLFFRSALTLNHHLFDFSDRFAWIEAFRTSARAIEDSVAAIKPERVFKVVEPLLLRFVATVGQPAPSLQERCGAEKAIAVPPMAWAAG